MYVKDSEQTHATVRLFNKSRFSARNPGVRLVVRDFYGLPAQPGWSTSGSDSTGRSELQWDGTIVHGMWSWNLPDLQFRGVTYPYSLDGCPTIEVSLAADGIKPKHQYIAIKLLETEDYLRHLRAPVGTSQATPRRRWMRRTR